MRRLLPSALAALGAIIASPAAAQRLKDIGQFDAVRSNPIVGYGIVVGLPGTGDDSLAYTAQGVKGAVSRLGLTLPPGVDPALKNAAAVMVTADLPAFAKPGQRLDVTVAALGKAKSLRGGTLIMTPLTGADGATYAIAQGNVAVGGLGVEAADGSKLSVNVPSAGRIAGGAHVERAVPNDFAAAPGLTFNLAQADISTAMATAAAINAAMGQPVAEAVDAVSITVAAPPGAAQRMALMARIEQLSLTPATAPARVIVNSRTGTVVINGAVRLTPAAVTHGKITVRIAEDIRISQPAPLSRGRTAAASRSAIAVEEANTPLVALPGAADLGEVVAALGRLGAGAGDLVAILDALKQAGAMSAELVIL